MEWFENWEMKATLNSAAEFARKEITDKIVRLDSLEKPEFPANALQKLAELDLLWGPAPEAAGGMNMNDITAVNVLSGLAEASAGFAATVAVHYAALASIRGLDGGDEFLKKIQQKKGGETATLVGIAYKDEVDLLPEFNPPGGDRGSNWICPVAPDKTDMTLLCREEAGSPRLVLVEREAFDSTKKENIHLSGCDEMPSVRLNLSSDALPGAETLAQGDDALKSMRKAQSALKLYFAAVMQGNARAATAAALDYATRRKQTGRAIVKHQNVRKKLVRMEVLNQAMASFVYRAALNENRDDVFDIRDMLYAFTGESAETVCLDAIQTLGGYGYMKDYGLEKRLRDSKTLDALLHSHLYDRIGGI